MPSFLQIITNTPLWVWPLLVLTVWLGVRGLRLRTVSGWRMAILPIVGIALSIAGIAQSAQPGLSAAGWMVALLAALPLGYAIGLRRVVRVLERGRLEIEGGRFMLIFGLSIFAVRYALGVLFGVLPALAREPAWSVASGALGGALAGIGIGWLAGVLRIRPSWTWVRRAPLVLGGVLLLIAGIFGAVIAFDSPAAIPPLAAGESIPGISTWNRAEIPPVSRVAARDGAPLTYRLYPGRKDRAVVLVHGSSGASASMHKSAQALQAAGATVYAISLRGHGGSGTTNGDTSYKRQLDDDLVDFVKATGLDAPGIHRTLIGFSSGGGFVLRTASGPDRAAFDAYLAISPYVGRDAPTTRPTAGGWVSVALPRIVALSILDGFGLPWFQGLPVIRYATDAKPDDNRTPAYSYRLFIGMHPERDWRAGLARIDRPMAVIAGANDELFNAEHYRPVFAKYNPRVTVAIEPGLGHLDMIADPKATAAVAALWRQLTGDQARRFDFKVREDMFAGFDGDKEALDRAMTLIASTLAATPDHAEALAWRGGARLFQSGGAFQRGVIGDGRRLAAEGLADLERAGTLAPGSIGVRAVRAPALMLYANGVRPFVPAEADRLTRLAVADFEFILTTRTPDWSGLAEHDRGEVLGALAEAWLQLGDGAHASPYLDRIAAELPGTPYAQNAALRRADPLAKAPLTCLGCH